MTGSGRWSIRPGRMTVGELFVGHDRGAAALTAAHLVSTSCSSASPGGGRLPRGERGTSELHAGRWPTVVLSNHDQSRHASRRRLGRRDRPDGDAIARRPRCSTHAPRHAVPVLRRGDRARDVADPAARSSTHRPPRGGARPRPWWNRDRCRTPMPWRPGPTAASPPGRPWLRMAPTSRRATSRPRTPTRVPSWPPTRLIDSPRAAGAPGSGRSTRRARSGRPRLSARRRRAGGRSSWSISADAGRRAGPTPRMDGATGLRHACDPAARPAGRPSRCGPTRRVVPDGIRLTGRRGAPATMAAGRTHSGEPTCRLSS